MVDDSTTSERYSAQARNVLVGRTQRREMCLGAALNCAKSAWGLHSTARVGMRVVWSIRARRAFVSRFIHLRWCARASIIKLRCIIRRERERMEADNVGPCGAQARNVLACCDERSRNGLRAAANCTNIMYKNASPRGGSALYRVVPL